MIANIDKKPSYAVFQRLLKASNISLRKFAREIGIGRTTFYDWKNGLSAPKTYKLILIAEYFGVDVKEFFEEY